jgi:hypothetical protein
MKKEMLILAVVALLAAGAARADTPQISNIKMSPRDAKTAQVRFDLTWPNAVRPGTHDVALWVFFKARSAGSAEWRHLRLVADQVLNPTGYGQTGGFPMEFVVPRGPDGFTGMFLRRTQDGRGTLVASNLTAVVEWGANIQHPTSNTQLPTPDPLKPETRNLPARHSLGDGGTPEIRVFAIEMAYVPEGPFDAGSSGQSLANRLFAHTGQDVARPERYFQTDVFDPSANTPPYRIAGPGAIPTGRQPGKLWAQGLAPEDGGEIPAAFPNGYAGFYAMKRALTQGQYAAFLSTLTDAQAGKRYYPNGHGTAIKRSGDSSNYTYTASSPDDQAPFICWSDAAAFCAWAGLRPMTELEYAKAYAAGIDLLHMQVSRFYERLISIASASGRAFTGTHGLGTTELPADWPKGLDGIVYGSVGGQRRAAKDVFFDRTSACRAVRSVSAGDAGLKADIAYRLVPRPIARLARAMRADGALGEWDKPLAVLKAAEDISPERFRQPPSGQAGEDAASWQGEKDLAAQVYLGWDGDALCAAFDVTDDKHFNAYASQDIGRGDCLTVGLSTPRGRWRIGLALTQKGVAFHQWVGGNEELAQTAGLAVVRDDAGGVTRYELRLPLAALGLKPGDDSQWDAVVTDDDDGFGQAYQIQMEPGLHVMLAP